MVRLKRCCHFSDALRGKIQLVFTSPPFPLNNKKRYGNLTGTAYINWLKDFALLFCSMLAPDGSIVIELGNAWTPGRPVMDTLALEALLAFKEAAKLNLCQEFICHNPARLPSPAQWVNMIETSCRSFSVSIGYEEYQTR